MKPTDPKTQPQPHSTAPLIPTPEDLSDMKSTQQNIQSHINKLAELNSKFHKRQEESFLITFAQVMDRMSEELVRARKRYQNIDIEVKKTRIYGRLEEELEFYKRDNAELRRGINLLKLELGARKERGQELKLEVTALKNRLRSKSVVSDKNTIVFKRLRGREREGQLEMPEIQFSTTARKVFFKMEDRDMQMQGSERRFNNTSLDVKRKKEREGSGTHCPLETQLKETWREYKREYPKDMSSIKPKIKEKLLEGFIGSPKVKESLKAFLLLNDNF